jgi:hypothetical protein
MTFDEIRALDAGVEKDIAFAGTKVPTFDEVLDYAREKSASMWIARRSLQKTSWCTSLCTR